MQRCRKFGGCPNCRRVLSASRGWGGASAATCWSCARLQTDVWLSGRWVRCAYVMWSLWKADCLPWNSWWALLCLRTLPSGWAENTDLQAVIFFSAFRCFTVVICLTWNRWNETTFSAIFYFIKISMQRTNWGGKWSPERLMQFFYYAWTTASLPHYSWETAFTSHSAQQFTGFGGRRWPANMTSVFGSFHRSFQNLESPFNP